MRVRTLRTQTGPRAFPGSPERPDIGSGARSTTVFLNRGPQGTPPPSRSPRRSRRTTRAPCTAAAPAITFPSGACSCRPSDSASPSRDSIREARATRQDRAVTWSATGRGRSPGNRRFRGVTLVRLGVDRTGLIRGTPLAVTSTCVALSSSCCSASGPLGRRPARTARTPSSRSPASCPMTPGRSSGGHGSPPSTA